VTDASARPLPNGSPALTVIVPSVNGADDLLPCLDALALQRDDAVLEVIVVDRLGAQLRDAVRRGYSWVRIVEAPAGATIPAMRMMGFDAATGDFVAVIEDHVQVPQGWAAALLATQHEGPAVVGGGVYNTATDHTVDWAAFLCEYSHCIPPLAAGPAEWLTGNNVIYPRKLLQGYRNELSPEKWENYLHDLMRRDGIPLMCHPEIVVAHKKHYTIREYTTQRYYYARSYAGARVAGASFARRLAFGAASFALPPLLYYRVVSRVVSKHRHRAELVRSLPLLALFVTSWAAGEIVGSWFGPGDSLSRVC
jgi:glycosyltransferase involved in cell wall biosynthesis